MGWGISETASAIEKIKSESADYLHGLNSCGVIDWHTYSRSFDFYMDLLDRAYAQGKNDVQQTIDPVRKGKWIVYVVSMLDGEDCKCSECGQISCAPYWNYCPNCGAKMEEPEDIPMEYFESGGR